MSYQKLVRDKIPDIIRANGETPITRTLKTAEYRTELHKKLLEEANEIITANTKTAQLEELSDLLEVMLAIGKIHHAELEDIIQLCEQKRAKRGGFDQRIFLEGVTTKKN